MQTRTLRPNMAIALIAFSVLFSILLACARSIQTGPAAYWSASGSGLMPRATGQANPAVVPAAAQSDEKPQPGDTPTPDDPHSLPAISSETRQHTVQAGESLGSIAREYGVSLSQILGANEIPNPDIVPVGTVLTIPAPQPVGTGPAFKVIPDSELVYGPAAAAFSIEEFVNSQGGYLANYNEEVEGVARTGAQVVQRVADDYSVNPRLLLAVLEHQSGWVTNPFPDESTLTYPLGLPDPRRKGLYFQLAWTANALNRGYYVYRVGGASTWLLADDTIVPIDPTINAGTAAVQHLFSALYDRPTWEQTVSEAGLFATYNRLFGYPFAFAVEPLIPPDLAQPALQLPFEAGQSWAFTGGPHGGWGNGTAWAAIDFAPPGEALGCVQSEAWVVAVTDGVIVRTGNGAVVQDLDGDGSEHTGWVIFYMHIETRDRIEVGTQVKAGDRIGHPSCEGGVSTGTHLHIARKYNGEWISADQNMPFVLDGWVSKGSGYEYNGWLERDGREIEAYAGRSPDNGIQR